jgi:hypothetical protein
MTRAFLVALAAVVLFAPAALAADPGAALTADLQKLSADRATMHAAVLADIQKITTDAQSSSKGSLRTALTADIKTLKSDLVSNHAVMVADRAQAYSDYQEAKAAGVPRSELASQLQQLLSLWQLDAKDLAEDATAAQQAIAAVQSHLQS